MFGDADFFSVCALEAMVGQRSLRARPHRGRRQRWCRDAAATTNRCISHAATWLAVVAQTV